MAGFGNSPYGSAPFGIGTPAAATEKPTGGGGSRFLNPVTRDYQVDATTGQYAQMPSLRQRVVLAVATELNSSAFRNFGIRAPRKMGDSFDAEMRSAVATALRHLIETEKAIRLDSVTVERGTLGRARVTISWTDLATGERDRATI